MSSQAKPDYLKYYRVIRSYLALQHDIDNNQVEMLMYLYSFSYFTWDDIAPFQKTIFFARNAFDELVERMFINIYAEYKIEKGGRGRGRGGGRKNRVNCVTYKLSQKSKAICASFYAFMEKERLLEMNQHDNVLLRYNHSKRVVATRDMMFLLNKEIQLKRADSSYKMEEYDLDF